MNALSSRFHGTTQTLSVGDLVTDLVFEHGRGERLPLRALQGRPFIMAFSSVQGAGGGALVRADGLRSEILRGSAAILMLSAPSPWFTDGDDPVSDLTMLGTAEGEGALPTDANTLTLFAVDAEGIVRRVHVEAAGPHEASAGITAVRAAMKALQSTNATRCGRLSRCEMAIASMVSTLALLPLEDSGVPSESPISSSRRVSEIPRRSLTASRFDRHEEWLRSQAMRRASRVARRRQRGLDAGRPEY